MIYLLVVLVFVGFDVVTCISHVCANDNENPNIPCIPCPNVPSDFFTCAADWIGPPQHNKCSNNHLFVNCTVLDEVECHGTRTFLKRVDHCERFRMSHSCFPTTLILSLFVGWTGADRFYLGRWPSALGKLFTLGGLGVWWIVDIVLVCQGQLGPTGDTSYQAAY